jgi:hypothetical protein
VIRPWKNMGAVSSSSTETVQEVENIVLQSCKNTVDTNQSIFANIALKNCNYFTFNASNVTQAYLKCDLSQNLNNAIETIQASESVSKAGLWGIAFSDSSASATQKIRNYLNSSCSNQASQNQVIATSVTCQDSDHAKFDLLNKFNLESACNIATILNNAEKAKLEAKSNSEGYDPFSGLGKTLIIIAIVIGALALVGIIIFAVISKKSSNGQIPLKSKIMPEPVAPK